MPDDEGRRFGTEIEDGCRDLLGPAHPSDRLLSHDPRHPVRGSPGEARHHRRIDDAGAGRVHPDVAGRIVEGGRLGEADHPGTGGSVDDDAALAGFGLAYLPEDQVQDDLTRGRLERVRADWCEPFSGYHLYDPSRRHHAAAFAVPVEAPRYRPSGP